MIRNTFEDGEAVAGVGLHGFCEGMLHLEVAGQELKVK